MNILTIGTSIITSRFIDALSMSQYSRICAVYSREMSRAISLAYPLGAKAYDDLDHALNNHDIDTVYVASANHLHFEHASKALSKGKHVILEKPVTSDEIQFDTLLEIARRNNVFLIEAITTLHLPNYAWIKSQLDKIGKVKHVYTSYHQYSSKLKSYLNHEEPNVFNLKTSGGCLVDLNVYNLHFILSLWDSPLSGAYYPTLGYNGVDTSGIAILQFADFVAIASASKTHEGKQCVIIEGEQGTIESSSAANKLSHCVLITKTEKIESPHDDVENVLVHEVRQFEVWIRQRNAFEVYAHNEESKRVITWMSKIRKEANLLFEQE